MKRITWGVVLGALGGVASWLVAEPLLELVDRYVPALGLEPAVAAFLPPLAFGCSAGVYLGIFLGIGDGILAKNSRIFTRGLLLGGLAGFLAGILGAAIGEFMIQTLGGSAIVRALGWGVFGGTLGVGPGLVMRSRGRARRGLIGGAFGGVLGGLLFGLAHGFTGVNVYARSLGLPVMGAVLGVAYAIAETLLRQAWLTILSGKAEGYELVLGTEPVILGGGSRADVRLIADPPVPGIAARVSPTENGYRIEKLDIETIQVNDEAIEEIRLVDGDVIRIGRIRVLFRDRAQRETTDRNRVGSGKLPVKQRTTDKEIPSHGTPKAGGAYAPPRRFLVGLDGEFKGRKFALEGDLVRVGRDDENEIVLDEGSISNNHAEIVKKGKWTVLFDRGSTNGTFVKDRRVAENALRDGFELKFGQLRFEYHEDPE